MSSWNNLYFTAFMVVSWIDLDTKSPKQVFCDLVFIINFILTFLQTEDGCSFLKAWICDFKKKTKINPRTRIWVSVCSFQFWNQQRFPYQQKFPNQLQMALQCLTPPGWGELKECKIRRAPEKQGPACFIRNQLIVFQYRCPTLLSVWWRLG